VRLKTEATLHYCDGCAKEFVQLAQQDLPHGFYVEVFDVTGGGADGGKLFICSEKCILRAFKRRTEIWGNQP
jgi:hypothetical protein